MIVGSINEDRNIESRVAITPDNVKKFIGLGLKVLIEKNYARHLGICLLYTSPSPRDQ